MDKKLVKLFSVIIDDTAKYINSDLKAYLYNGGGGDYAISNWFAEHEGDLGYIDMVSKRIGNSGNTGKVKKYLDRIADRDSRIVHHMLSYFVGEMLNYGAENFRSADMELNFVFNNMSAESDEYYMLVWDSWAAAVDRNMNAIEDYLLIVPPDRNVRR